MCASVTVVTLCVCLSTTDQLISEMADFTSKKHESPFLFATFFRISDLLLRKSDISRPFALAIVLYLYYSFFLVCL